MMIDDAINYAEVAIAECECGDGNCLRCQAIQELLDYVEWNERYADVD